MNEQDSANALLNMGDNIPNRNQPFGNVPPPVHQPEPANEFQQMMAVMNAMMQQNTALIRAVTQNQVQPTYNVLPDLSHNISEFDGPSGPASAKVWLRQLESTANLHRWTEAIAFETARSRLTRAARNWYLANIELINNWRSFRAAFSNTFTLDKSLTEKWQEMQSRNQKHGENTKEYFFDKVRLCKALGMELDEIKTQVAVGLWSREISTAVMSRSPFDVDDLLRGILELETLEATRKQRINHHRDSTKSDIGRRNNSSEEERKGNSRGSGSAINQRSDISAVKDGRECFRCHTVGHMAKECPVKREVKCYNCAEVGHISKDCTKPKKLSTAQVNSVDTDKKTV